MGQGRASVQDGCCRKPDREVSGCAFRTAACWAVSSAWSRRQEPRGSWWKWSRARRLGTIAAARRMPEPRQTRWTLNWRTPGPSATMPHMAVVLPQEVHRLRSNHDPRPVRWDDHVDTFGAETISAIRSDVVAASSRTVARRRTTPRPSPTGDGPRRSARGERQRRQQPAGRRGELQGGHHSVGAGVRRVACDADGRMVRARWSSLRRSHPAGQAPPGRSTTGRSCRWSSVLRSLS